VCNQQRYSLLSSIVVREYGFCFSVFTLRFSVFTLRFSVFTLRYMRGYNMNYALALLALTHHALQAF
jgi:hypothetical protein